MPHRNGGNIVVHILQGQPIDGCRFSVQCQLLPLILQKPANIILTHSGINIGELVIDACDKFSKRIVDAACNFFRIGLYTVSIHIDIRVFQRLCQKQLCGFPPVASFNSFCRLDLLKLCCGA